MAATACSGNHRERLFVGEANFTGVESLLKKHEGSHPNLGASITATELETNGRDSESCEACKARWDEADPVDQLAVNTANLLIKAGDVKEGIFCSDLCKRIQSLKDRGVTVILGYDGTKMDTHAKTTGKTFKRIHWNCPHDKSNYSAQSLPPIIFDFFKSAALMQNKGDRVHVTLAQPIIPYDKTKFFQGVVYNIRNAAHSNGYYLFAKRPFGPSRYPGYQHQQTGSSSSAPSAERQREFVFIKGNLPANQLKSKFNKQTFSSCGVSYTREYYIRDSDDESSSYSSAGDSDE